MQKSTVKVTADVTALSEGIKASLQATQRKATSRLVFIENSKVVTDSLTVADMFGKEHKHILRDIERLECSAEFSQSNFGPSTYKNERGREYPKYNMTRDGFTFLVMGYTGKEAARFKEDYIRAFNDMEQQLTLPSYAIADNITRAEKWIIEERQRQALETKALMLEQRVAEYEPKISYLDRILRSKSTVTITQIAKDYGMSGQQLNKILHDEKVQYKLNGQWLLYRQYHDQGFTKSETIEIPHNSGEMETKMTSKWTQKGRLFIHELLTRRGILAVMDRIDTDN